MELSAKQRIESLDCELSERNMAHANALKSCQLNADRQCDELKKQLQSAHDKEMELLKRLNEFSVTENQLRDKVMASENEFATRLQASAMRERELTEKVNHLSRQLEAADARFSDLENQAKLQEDELKVMRQNRILQISNGLLSNGTMNASPNSSMCNDSFSGVNTSGLNTSSTSQMLQDEVESLRCVLELKQTEIAELRKKNREMQSAQDELPKAQFKIANLQLQLENALMRFESKCEEEK